jgi:hypothetical protein
MKIEILRQVMISGESVLAGSILEVEYQQAATLINLGKAVEFKGEVEACEAKPAAKEKPSEEEAPKPKTTTRKRTKE